MATDFASLRMIQPFRLPSRFHGPLLNRVKLKFSRHPFSRSAQVWAEMDVAAAVAGRKEACGRGADGVAGCRETGKGPCFLPATPQDQFIACSRDDSIHVPAHVPQPSGVRGLAAAHALPGPPITSLMHASACHRTRMHAPAHTAEPVCSPS